VRYDLAEASAATIEAFLKDNQYRRQLDILAKARVALRLYEIERKRKRGGLYDWEKTEARDRVGKAINMSGRNLARYFNILKGVQEVQDAFRAGMLPLVLAERVANLDARVQKALVARIRGGENPRQVVSEFLPMPAPRQDKALTRLLRALAQGREELDYRIKDIKSGDLFGTTLDDLRKGLELINSLILRLEHNRKTKLERLARMGEEE
jgi:hypothetical protein